MKIAITIIQLLCGLFLIAIVLLQTGKSAGLSGAIGGSNDMFSTKAQSKTLDAKLAKWTKWVSLAFVLLTFLLDLI
jgi:preprotein translocase subunit SecG